MPDLKTPFLAAALLLAVPAVQAEGHGPPAPIEFGEAELFFELNDTDGDLGIHANIDGEPWSRLEIISPHGRRLVRIRNGGGVLEQGLTQLAFESAEPTFDELDPADFFDRFPEGEYTILARTTDGRLMLGEAELSHVLAAPADGILISGVPALEDCDAGAPSVSAPVLIEWEPVTESHPELGAAGPIEIELQQVFVENDDVKVSLDLSPEATEVEIPAAITDAGGEFKLEILVRTADGNNTAVETCFSLD